MINRTNLILCYVTDRRGMGVRDGSGFAPLLARIRAAAQAGVDWIQIREKDLPGRELEDLVVRAVKEVRASGASQTRVIVNDRLDVAIAAGANGVHLGEQSIPVREVVRFRQQAKKIREFLIGASSHSLERAVAAAEEGADYVFFGPAFATPSKAESGAPQGLKKLAEVCRRVRVPVLAIGGITSENAAQCAAAGAAGIAAIRLFQAGEAELPALVAGMKGKR